MAEIQIAAALGKAVAPAAVAMARGLGKRKYDEAIALYTNALDDFMDASFHRVSEIKTLINSENPIAIEDIYVDTKFYSDKYSFTDDVIIQKLKTETGAYAVVGLAGSGKSMFMKYAANFLIKDMVHHQRIALFIEVRDLDFSDDNSALERMIFDYCTTAENTRTFEQFEVGLREGMFIVMLDGMDEAPANKLDGLLGKVQAFN